MTGLLKSSSCSVLGLLSLIVLTSVSFVSTTNAEFSHETIEGMIRAFSIDQGCSHLDVVMFEGNYPEEEKGFLSVILTFLQYSPLTKSSLIYYLLRAGGVSVRAWIFRAATGPFSCKRR